MIKGMRQAGKSLRSNFMSVKRLKHEGCRMVRHAFKAQDQLLLRDNSSVKESSMSSVPLVDLLLQDGSRLRVDSAESFQLAMKQLFLLAVCVETTYEHFLDRVKSGRIFQATVWPEGESEFGWRDYEKVEYKLEKVTAGSLV